MIIICDSMKVLQVITSLHTGGAEKLIVDVTSRLRRKGHQVDVALFDGEKTPFYKELENTGCTIHRFSNKPSFYNPIYIWRLYKVMKNYDIIHTHNTSPQFFAALANIFRQKILVTTEHNTSNRRRGKLFWKPIDKWMYSQYRQIICISDKAEENLKEYLNNRKLNICTIYNGIDVQRFYHALPIEELKSEKFITVMVAAFRKQKDQKTLIKAIATLPKDKYELWLVGAGDCFNDIQHFVQKNGLDDQVKFLGNRTDVPNILHSADVICMSSHYEGLSLSNLEGMSIGKPFVATDVDGLHEVTEGAGILVPHENVTALAGVIRRLHDDKDFYQQTADACYRRALKFDINKMVDAYEAVYHNILP